MPGESQEHPLICLHEREFGEIQKQLENVVKCQTAITTGLNEIVNQINSSALTHANKHGEISTNLTRLCGLVEAQSEQINSIVKWAVEHDGNAHLEETDYALFKKNCEICVDSNRTLRDTIVDLEKRLAGIEKYRTIIIGIVSILTFLFIAIEAVANSKGIIEWFTPAKPVVVATHIPDPKLPVPTVHTPDDTCVKK